MKATRTMAMAVGTALLATGLFAAPSVEITSVQQQYPWTNTVDIVYTVAGVESETNGYFVVFTPTTSTGVAIPDVNGEKSVQVALKGSGVYSTQWFPQTNQQYTACKMTPSVFRGAAKDYLIINLTDWSHTYEPMATQESSNQRYNTAEYKTSKLVLRRVSEGKHDIGHDDFKTGGPHNELVNSRHTVSVPSGSCYYIGVFPVTIAQYKRVMGTDLASTDKTPAGASWNILRGSALSSAKLIGNANNSSSFLIRLSGLTGLPIDLPTLEMHEIATRAGKTTKYFWGDTLDTAYCRYSLSRGTKFDVGSLLPNAWGLYDVAGHVWEYVLDTYDNKTDLALKTTDIYTPRTTGTASQISIRAGCSDNPAEYMYASYAGYRSKATGDTAAGRDGFRIAIIER